MFAVRSTVVWVDAPDIDACLSTGKESECRESYALAHPPGAPVRARLPQDALRCPRTLLLGARFLAQRSVHPVCRS
jgi:hypothetical protein